MSNNYRININILKHSLFKWTILFAILFLPLWATLSDYGITCDEPIYMEATLNIKKWLSLETADKLKREIIDQYWKPDPRRNIHPSGLKWFYVIAQKTIFWEKDAYMQNGIFNILLFSISVIIFLNWWNRNSFWRHLFFVLILLTIPRFFAHIHFPATDIPMTSFLLLFLVCLERTLLGKGFWVAGLVLGFLASIKITSLLLTFPIFLAMIIGHRDKLITVLVRLSLVCLVGLIFFYIINPDYWYSPFSRSFEFLSQTLTRKTWTPVTLFFNGHYYSYRGPFYYPFIIFLITTPILHIVLLLTGLVSCSLNNNLRKDFKTTLLFICLLFPFIILALPISPAHDGIRYLLPAFPFALCFMVVGLEKLWLFMKNQSKIGFGMVFSRYAVAIIMVTLFAIDIYGPARFPPFELSYYNKIVGGISGAYKRGYETTYWWEIINDDVIEHLNNLCGNAYVYFPLSPTDLFFTHMTKANKINFRPTQKPNEAEFMLIYGRPFVGFWEFHSRSTLKKNHIKPYKIWEISLDSVPLMRLYRLESVSTKLYDPKKPSSFNDLKIDQN